MNRSIINIITTFFKIRKNNYNNTNTSLNKRMMLYDKIKKIKFKYDGSCQMMIIKGELMVADPDLCAQTKINIFECNNLTLEKIEYFLNSTWKPSKATYKKWFLLRKPILNYFLNRF